MFVDLCGRPKFLLKYKIQKDKNVPVKLFYIYIICSSLTFEFEVKQRALIMSVCGWKFMNVLKIFTVKQWCIVNRNLPEICLQARY